MDNLRQAEINEISVSILSISKGQYHITTLLLYPLCLCIFCKGITPLEKRQTNWAFESDLFCYQAQIILFPQPVDVLPAILFPDPFGKIEAFRILLFVFGKLTDCFGEGGDVYSLEIVSKENGTIEIEIPDEIGDADRAGLQKGHREKLIEARKEKEIRKSIIVGHFLPFDDADEADVFPLFFHLLLQLGISVRDGLERETAQPQEEDVGVFFRDMEEIEDAFPGLDLADADDDETVFRNIVEFPESEFSFVSDLMEEPFVDEVRDIGDVFLLDAKLFQGFDEAGVDDDELFRPFVEGDDITAEEREYRTGKADGPFQRLRKEVDVADGERLFVHLEIETGIDGMDVDDVRLLRALVDHHLEVVLAEVLDEGLLLQIGRTDALGRGGGGVGEHVDDDFSFRRHDIPPFPFP